MCEGSELVEEGPVMEEQKVAKYTENWKGGHARMFLTRNLSTFTPVSVLWGIAAVCPPEIV